MARVQITAMDRYRAVWILVTLSLCFYQIKGHGTKTGEVLENLKSDFAVFRWTNASHENGQSILEITLLNTGVTLPLTLERNSGIIHNKFVTRILRNGNEEVHKKTTSFDCLYQGTISNLEASRVVLHGCSTFFKGNIFYKGKQWAIKMRRRDKKKVLHSIIRARPERVNIGSSCMVDEKPNHYLRENQRKIRHKRSSDVKLLELYVVFSHDMYTRHLGAERRAAEEFASDMAGHLDTIYKFDVGVHIALVGVEVWESRDEVAMVKDAKELLRRFIEYGKTASYTFKYDLAALITDVNFDYNIAGMAHVDVMCSPLSAAVIKHFPGSSNPNLKAAVTLAHEIGHALGLVHDTDKCACSDVTGKCIMAADTSVDPQSFSECSKKALKAMFDGGGASCLYDAPPHVFRGPICGNGIKEEGEVCDCGGVIECIKDKCCNSGCVLKPRAQCNSGSCCKNCQIVKAGMICRPQKNECDIEEFCDGAHSECPANLHLPDMGTCGPSASKGFCYKGKCRNAQAQCQFLWGPAATAAHYSCYQRNLAGRSLGNCGVNRNPMTTTYKTCTLNNIMCGRLQCVTRARTSNVGLIRRMEVGMSGTWTCVAVSIDLGDDVPDPGLVDDGTPCTNFDPPSNNQPGICLSGDCVVLQTVPKTHCPVDAHGQECSNQGTCTNDGSCFCEDGYTGSDCSQVGGVTRIRPSTTAPTPPSTTTALPITTKSPSVTDITTANGVGPKTSPSVPTTQKPTSETIKDHLTEIICGVLGGLIGLAAFFFLLWRFKKPKAFWKWLDNRPSKSSTSPQKGVPTAWGKPGNHYQKPQGYTNKPMVMPGVIGLPGAGSHGKGHQPSHQSGQHGSHGNGQHSAHSGSAIHPSANSHGKGFTKGHENVFQKEVHQNHGHGRGHGRGRGRGRGRGQSRNSTSDYGSQESIESIKLYQDECLPGAEPKRW